MLPKIKTKITSFLVGEEGKISKQSLLSLGSFISAAVIGGILATKEAAAQPTNDLTVSYADGTATGTHAHHSSGGGCTACSWGCGGGCFTGEEGGGSGGSCSAGSCACGSY